MNNIDLVKNNQAMIKSGALTIHNPMWDKIKAKLEHMRIRAGTPLPEMKHLLNINGVNWRSAARPPTAASSSAP